LPDSNFWVQLQGITGLDPLEAQKHADSVRKAYLDDIRHIKAEKKGVSGESDMGGSGIDASMSTINVQAGPFNPTIPLTKEGIELAKGFLNLLGKQLGVTHASEPQKEEG
jgi:hypothetical protein